MTEKTGKIGVKDRKSIDPIAFIIAVLAAPLIVTIMTFWLYLPILALLMGYPSYLIAGTPVLLWYLRRFEPHILSIALLALMTNIIAAGAVFAFATVAGHRAPADTFTLYASWGSLFSVLWSAMFHGLYQGLRRTPVQTDLTHSEKF